MSHRKQLILFPITTRLKKYLRADNIVKKCNKSVKFMTRKLYDVDVTYARNLIYEYIYTYIYMCVMC